MILSRRQQQLLLRIRHDGYAAIEALAEDFEVTPQTIRRDINTLCEQGLLTRYHGGAGVPSSSIENIAYSARQILNMEGKQRIAEMIARHIPHHASLFINIGTTTEEAAKALRHHDALRVITNNLNVAAILCDNPSIEVIVAGGLVRHRDRAITGEVTIDFVSQFKVDYGIIGISGIESDGTLLDFDYHEVRVSQAMLRQSRKVFLVADHSKFNRNALVRLGDLSQIHALFTDLPVPDELRPVLEEAKTEVHVACEEVSLSNNNAQKRLNVHEDTVQ
jgi:DeoR family glycerol-3-phosphate regulon repressor